MVLSTGHVSVTWHVCCYFVPCSMPLHIPLGAFQKWASCLPDVVALQRLCLFHHFSLVFVLLLWLDRLCSEIMQLFVCFKCVIVYISEFVEVGTRSFIYKTDWLHSAVSLSTSLDLLLCRLNSPWNREEGRLWEAAETGCGAAAGNKSRTRSALVTVSQPGGYWGGIPTLSLPTVRCQPLSPLNPQHPLSSPCVSLLCKLMQTSSYYN